LQFIARILEIYCAQNAQVLTVTASGAATTGLQSLNTISIVFSTAKISVREALRVSKLK
jgi:hypothetical protein